MAGTGSIGGGGDWLRGGVGTVMSLGNNALVNPGNALQTKTGSAVQNAAIPGLQVGSDLTNYLYGGLGGGANIQNEIAGYNPTSILSQLSNLGNYSTPQLTTAQNQLYGAGMQLGQPYSIAQQNFNTGGWTPQYQQQYGNLSSYLGQQTPGLQTSAGSANSLVGGLGATNYNQSAQSMANSILGGNGGYTPQLSMALAPIQGIIGAAGNTAQSQALQSGANPLLAAGGQTALGQNMAQTGVGMYSGQALMTPSQAAALARQQAATNNQQAESQAETQAMARGGGAGATVANGLQNQGMADFYNTANQNISSAVNTALQNQQQLNLTQQGQGINLAQGAGSLQNSLLGTSGGLMGTSGNMANSLLTSGLGEIPGITNAAANYMSPYVSYGTGGMSNQSSMLGNGTNLASMLEQGQLGGLNSMNTTMANQNQYDLGQGGLANSFAGTEGNIFNNLFGTGISSGQLGLNQFTGLTGAQNASLNTQLGMGNLLNTNESTYLNPLTALSQEGAGMIQSGVGDESGMFNGMANAATQQSPLIGELASVLAAI